METRTVVLLFLAIFVIGFLYSIAKGFDIGTSAISGFGIGAISMLLIYFGKRIVKPD